MDIIRPHGGRRVVMWWLVGLLLATPAAAQQRGADTRTWYQAYQDGRQQVQRGQWEAAIASLEAAKRNGPKPGRRIPFYGDVFDDFLPDYYLGIAYLNAGRAQDAVKAFSTVRDAKLIAQRDREYTEFIKQATVAEDRARAAAPTQVAQQPPLPQPSPQQQAQQPQPPAPVTQSAANNPPNLPVPTPDAAVSKAPTPAPPSPAQTPPIRPATTPAPGPAVVGKQPAPRPNPPDVPNASAGGLRSEVDGLTAFFSGDYQRAANVLSALAVSGASPRVEFYLACSRAALVLTGGADAASLTEARTRFAALNANQFAGDQRYISPRILELLRSAPRQ